MTDHLGHSGDSLRDAISELEGHYAYDTGAVDSGVRDPARRKELVEVIDAASEDDLRWALSRFIRDAYVSEKGLQQGYGWEDAMDFARWFHDGDYRG